MAQCLDLWVLITLQSGHKSVGSNFSIKSRNSSSGSGFNTPGSFLVAMMYGMNILIPIIVVDTA